MKIVCKDCGTDLASGQIICAGRLCVNCYDKKMESKSEK